MTDLIRTFQTAIRSLQSQFKQHTDEPQIAAVVNAIERVLGGDYRLSPDAGPGVRVFVHTLGSNESRWRNEIVSLSRMPVVGDHVLVGTTDTAYRVELVVHCLPLSGSADGEVWAVEHDNHFKLADELRQAHGGNP